MSAKLDDPALPLVQRGQGLQRIVQRSEIRAPGNRCLGCVRQRDQHSAATPLRAALAPGDVDEDVSHQSRGNREEMSAILPSHFLPVDQSQVGLVHQGRRLQDVPGPFTCHIGRGHPVKLSVDERR